MSDSESAILSKKLAKQDSKGLKTRDHPDADLITKMLMMGRSPKRIEEWLRHKYPDDKSKWISERTLYSFRKNFINPKMVLPTSYYEEKIKELDCDIDALRELYNQIEIQKRRIAYNLKLEDKAEVSLPDTRKEMELLHTMLANAITLEMKLGIRREATKKIEVAHIDMNDLLEKYLEEKAIRNVIKT